MPLYTYKCSNCGIQFDALQKFTDKPLKRCPECNKSAVKRVIQPAGIIFKGSGWYKTDSASSSSGSSAGGKKKAEAKSAEASSTSESKPAESKTTEAKPSAKAASDD